jgi:uncharacterized protein YeaO (DUF488 family)
MDLLKPLFPRDLKKSYRQCDFWYKIEPSKRVGGEEEHARKQIEAFNAFIDVYHPWVERLEATKVHLALGPGY